MTTLWRLTGGASRAAPVSVVLVLALGGTAAWAEWIERWPQVTRR